MVTITPWVSCCSSAFSGSCTSSGFIMAEVVIMKMISRTRNTSVSGVMLMSAMMRRCLPRVPLLPIAIATLGAERFEQAGAADAQRGVDLLHARLEEVVEHDRCDADGQAEGRRDQRLRDAGRDHAEAPRARQRHGVKGANDADHRPEEPDEWRRRADRAE